MGITVVGSVAYDTIETPFGRGERILGGSGTHFSVSASFFTAVDLVGVVGDDFSDQHLDFLKSRNICLDGLECVPGGKTFHWEGRYGYDLSNPETLKTELNVFESFAPKLPAASRAATHAFLANIDPVLQAEVLDQFSGLDFVACDTMNFWIEGKPKELREVVSRVDAVFMNEGEIRLFAKTPNLVKAANFVQSLGPKIVVVKRGEYGALLFCGDRVFSAPGLPLEDIKDPTGAGDSFAGGCMGYLAKVGGRPDWEDLKQAVIYGSVMASFNVEAFSCDRLRSLEAEEIHSRYRTFQELVQF